MSWNAADKKKYSPPRPLTRKGQQTRKKIFEASRKVFEKQGFYGASVAEISRRAGLSQGAFYQYFKNKDQIFLELNDRILGRFWMRAHDLNLGRLAPEERLRGVLTLLYRHCRENHFYHRILGEFELIDSVTIGYFDSLARFCRSFFRQAINDGYIRLLDPNILAYTIIGMAVFHAMNWESAEDNIAGHELIDASVALIESGISGSKPWSMPKDLIMAPQIPVGEKNRAVTEELTQGKATARALFEAAEVTFGRYGYNRASVSEITRVAGVAQGSFYVHFKTKRDLLENFVRHLSREIRRDLKLATQRLSDRRDAELVGIISFFRFLSRHRKIYRVVAESETMGQEMAMWYYQKLAVGYRTGLAEGMAGNEIRNDLPVGFMVRSLMGMVHMIGLKWLVWNSSPQAEVSAQHAEDILKLILFGLKAR